MLFRSFPISSSEHPRPRPHRTAVRAGQDLTGCRGDVAQVVAAVLAYPIPHLGRIYELTGPQSQDLDGVAREFSDALNREVTYSDISPEEWEQKLKRQGMPEHLTGHLLAMGELHRAGRYDRRADGVQRVTGRPAMSVREFVSLYAEEFGGRRS